VEETNLRRPFEMGLVEIAPPKTVAKNRNNHHPFGLPPRLFFPAAGTVISTKNAYIRT
jgi:hypothetical protein